MTDPVAVVTPWYPTEQRPFHGSFVAGFVDAVHEHAGRPAHVYHLEAWGLPRGTAAQRRARRDLASLLRGPASRVPLTGDGIRVAHLPSPVRPGSSFGDIAHDHHGFFGTDVGVQLPEPIVHAHVGLGGGWPAMAMIAPDTRLFVTEHATFLERLLEEPAAKARYDEVIVRSERFFCVSDVLRDHLLDFFPDRAGQVSVLPNPIRFASIPKRSRPLDTDLRRWLYVGYLTERKGVEQLLESFAIAQGRHGDLELSLVGEGPLADTLRSRADELGIADRVEFLGAVAPAKMSAVYGDHDLLVHLSDYETFGMTLVEAAAVGCAVIVTRCGGPEETIGPIADLVGRMVSVERDPEEVAAAYDDLRGASAELDLVAGRASLEARYSFSAVANRLEAIYTDGASS